MSGSADWPRVRLGEVLRQVERIDAVDPSKAYRTLGVRWYGGGLFAKEELFGHQIAAPKLYRVQEGDFVYNRLFAWKGSFAVADQSAHGCHVSNEFPCFEVDRMRLDARYLAYWFGRESAWAWALGLSSGATPTSRNRLKETAFLSLQLPLPPLLEQQRIVARIVVAASHVKEAKDLQDAVAAEAAELCRALLRDAPDAVLTPLRDLVTLRPPDVEVRADESYHFAGVYCFGRGVFVGNRKTGMEFAYPKLTRLREGNFVYPKLMAWEGAFGVVPPECDGLVVSTEFPVFEVNRARVLPEVLDVHFRNPALWASIGGASTGTNVRRRRLNPQDFLDLQVPLPSMARQKVLAETCTRVRDLQARQVESRVMLEGLLPAILDRAFAGAL